MFFMSKTKKIKLYNEGKKRQIQDDLRIMQSSDGLDNQAAKRLEGIRMQIMGAPVNTSLRVGTIDYKIARYLEEAQADVHDGAMRVFLLRLKKVEKLLSERKIEAQKSVDRPKTKEEKRQAKIVQKRDRVYEKQYASNPGAFLAKAVTVDELYSTDDLMLITVSRLQDEVDELQRQIENLMPQYEDNPEDLALRVEIETLQSTLNKRHICQQMISAQSVREHSYELFETIEAQDKVKISKRKIGDDQYAMLEKKAGEILQKYGISSVPASESAAAQGAASFATRAPQAAPAGTLPQAPAISMTPAMQKRQLQKMKADCEKMRTQLQDQAEDSSEELPVVERELLKLLEKRKGSTASQCLILDMSIDELKVQRNRIIDSIKRVRQNIAIIDEQLPIIDAALISGEMKQITDKLGRVLDLSDLAVHVTELTKAGNEALEKAKTDKMVAGSVEVDFSSSVSETPDTVTVGEKDETKYADLEAELKRTMGDA